MNDLIFAANWKMHYGPEATDAFFDAFLSNYTPETDRSVWFFPPAVSLAATVRRMRGQVDIIAGVQNVHWEPKGAFTGETSVSMAVESGAKAALVGHSERRHVFGETDEETGKKVRAVLDAGITPVFCVGEKIEERKRGAARDVVNRQLSVLDGLDGDTLPEIVIAYEPVWAIGTGLNATPEDAAQMHGEIRTWFEAHGAGGEKCRILYGGSVKPENAASLVAESEINGVLVGGASLDPESWASIVRAGLD
jgi:triosephosphate isomerase